MHRTESVNGIVCLMITWGIFSYLLLCCTVCSGDAKKYNGIIMNCAILDTDSTVGNKAKDYILLVYGFLTSSTDKYSQTDLIIIL